ncbi:MAG TPA: hypothetical protein VGI80_05220, partial [Pyrinomonadaceae bacterium]
MKHHLISILFLLVSASGVLAQHQTPTPTPTPMTDMPGMDMQPKVTPTPTPGTPGMNMPGMNGGGMKMQMSSTVNIGDPMSREASGTSWDPDSSPTFGRMKMSGGGTWMFMGTAFVRYTSIG